MDIQRGDTVYYRGEVWTVVESNENNWGDTYLILARRQKNGAVQSLSTFAVNVQRVEQIR